MKLDDPQYEELIRARYNRACIGLFLTGLAALLISWRLEVAEMMGSAVFVLLILYRMSKPWIHHRFFPWTPEEKVSFWMLLIGVVLLYVLLFLCARHHYLEIQEQSLRDGQEPPSRYLPASRLPASHMPESLRPGAVRIPAHPAAPTMPRPVRF